MKYIRATFEYVDDIYKLVDDTIKTTYPKYYLQEVVDFFCRLHSKENIINDILNGNVWIVLRDNQVVGTGCCKDYHITRVYVSPDFQGQGYGSYIMDCLEKEISAKYDVAVLDSSLPACIMYEHRGYKIIRHEKYILDNNVVLVYEIMEKQLQKGE